MGIADEIESKPGGAALAEQVRKLESARPEAISAVAERWRTAAQKSDSCGADVDASVSGLDGAWEGASADAFVGYMGKVTQGFGTANGALDAAAAAMAKAAEIVGTGQDAISNIGERALADTKRADDAFTQQVRGHEHDTGFVQEAQRARDAQITKLLGEHAREAEVAVKEADQQLADSVGRIEQAEAELAGAFTPLPLADDQPFTPGRGEQTEWDFQQPGGPARTEPAAAPSPDGSGGPGSSGSNGSPGSGVSGGSGGSGTGGSGGSDGASATPGGGSGGGLGSSGGPPTSGPPPGNVDQWIREAIEILRANGIPVTEDNVDEIWTIIEKESGGDPHAINNWDSNAAKGTPSKGLMQCIDPTFDAHKLPGHGDIYDPVDNIIAGVRYTFDRYGGFEGHPGLESMAGGGGYQGY